MYEESMITDPQTRVRFGEMDVMTRVEADRLYKKIISAVYKDLKKHGFKRNGVNLTRIDQSMYQKLNFQRYTHLPSITINVSFRPFFLHYSDTSVLSFNKTLGNFLTNRDKWFGIKRDYEEVSNQLLDVLHSKLLPYYEKLNTPEKVLNHVVELENDTNVMYDELILFCALKVKNVDISLKYLNKEIRSLQKYLEEARSNNDAINQEISNFKYCKKLYDWVEHGRFSEIDKLLDKYEQTFLKELRHII